MQTSLSGYDKLHSGLRLFVNLSYSCVIDVSQGGNLADVMSSKFDVSKTVLNVPLIPVELD